MNELLYKNSPAHWLLSLLARLYLRFLGLTSSVTIKGRKDHPGPAVYALWHRQEVLMIWLHRHRGLCGMVSKSKDGEYMARILLGLGFNFLRGSSSSGGIMALRGLIKAAREGYSIAITPDGPKGPIFKAQPGIVLIAQKAGIPIIPAACALSRKKILRSWDKYQFPLPFGRIEAVYGEPIRVAETDDIAAKTLEVERALNALTEEAERLLAAGA
ncbi:MAG: lysophospholipid acyltransferase family protein [Elusimicrobiales bacterium]|nr:lysophospholipid acyltransferase family protein [Elusimicrobiales bacterium]